ncbi:hypothetical protein WDW86_02715 [Bdellovibrionota bacterium FG-2]
MFRKLLPLLVFSLLSLSAFAGEGKFSGVIFGDYYNFMSNHDTTSRLASDLGYKSQQGFWIRRINFNYDYAIDENFTSRFRLETANADFTTTTGGAYTALPMTPYVKDASLRYKYADGTMMFGLVEVPTVLIVEKNWGYRFIEKTPEDLWNGIGVARTLGVGSMGSYFNKLLSYHFTVGAGASVNNEINKGSKAHLSLSSEPIANSIFEVYGDYETNTHDYMSHVFGGYKFEPVKFGALYSYANKYSSTTKTRLSYNLFSLYADAKVMEKLNVFGRMDMVSKGMGYSAYIRQATTEKPVLYIAGVDFQPAKEVHISPNVELVKYETLDTDVIPRVTFSWAF